MSGQCIHAFSTKNILDIVYSFDYILHIFSLCILYVFDYFFTFIKCMILYIDDRKRKLVLRWLIVWKFEYQTCDRLGCIVDSNILKHVIVDFSYLFLFLVCNATDDEEAVPDHQQGYINANYLRM